MAAKKTTAKKAEAPQEAESQNEATEAEVPAQEQPTEEPAQESAPEATQPGPDVYGSPYGRTVQQKAVLYTDGISGAADQNHERAYEYSERLQSNDPRVREAGDQSISESAAELRSAEDTREAENVKQGGRDGSSS